MNKVLSDHRVVICVGSGGVGKTTTAAALGLAAAMAGKRVLTLTIDPAHRLAQSLGLERMETEEQHIDETLFHAAGLSCEGHLSAMMLDTKRTFDELIARHATSTEVRDRILNNKIYQYVSTSLAGTSEYMAMEKLHHLRAGGDWDLIVLDTPPTSNALDFLDAPERLSGLLDSPATRWFIQAFESSGRVSLNLVGKGAALVLKGLAKFTGAAFLDSVAEFVTDLNALFGGFRERATQVAQTLRSPEVAFVVVTSTHALAIEEALFFHERLVSLQMKANAFVVNGVQPLREPPSVSSEQLRDLVAQAVPHLTDPKKGLRQLQRAFDDEHMQAVADRTQILRLSSQTAAVAPCIEVPLLEEDVHSLPTLNTVAQHLIAQP